ncbi:MAG: type II toxin-antitoxin system VapC family toxin [Limisphaerales bacterium]
MTVVLVDTGPLVAYLNPTDQNHDWAVAQFSALRGHVITCEPVWTEAIYLVSEHGGNIESLWNFLRRGTVQFGFDLETEYESIAILMRRYADLPMDLADACLVRMSELHRDCRVLTTDGHFKIYRRFGRQIVPLICPE